MMSSHTVLVCPTNFRAAEDDPSCDDVGDGGQRDDESDLDRRGHEGGGLATEALWTSQSRRRFSIASEIVLRCGGYEARRWCTNRNWHATIPTAGASSTDGVRSWAAHVGHRIQHVAREQRFDRSPTGRLGSKTIADDRLVPEEGVLDPRLLMVA